MIELDRASSFIKQSSQAGFTIIELMTAVAVLAVIAMMAAPSMFSVLEKQRFHSKERELIMVLTEAKSMAILKKTDVRVDLDSPVGNSETEMNWYAGGGNLTLTIQSLAEDATTGTFSGTEINYDRNGRVDLVQDALITVCNTKLKIKKQLVLTHLGAVYTKPEGTC